MSTRFRAQGIELADGSCLPIHSAEFHYWRSERESWGKALAALKDIGINIISSYVPWSVHERSKGVFDFTGPRDVRAFIDEVEAAGLHLMLRPGPHINAELTHFGFPERVLAQKSLLARSARGTPLWLPAPPKFFPVPSYASSEFQAEVKQWLSAFAEQVAARLHPHGPIVALQVDNEMQMFWRLAAFDSDYHPDALRWWREFDDRPAPTEYREDELGVVLSWLRFKESYVARSLGWITDMLIEGGLGSVARYHNLPPSRPALCHGPDAARAIGGVVGMDVYDVASGYRRVRERANYLASSSELAFAPELGLGGPPWFPIMSEEDQRNVMLGALAGGVHAFNLYMGVGRERWYGGLLDADGAPSATAEWLRPLLAALRRTSFSSLRRVAPIALILSRAEERAAIASCALEAATPCVSDFLDLGPAGHAELALDESARLQARWMQALQEALDLAELPYQLVDEAALHLLAPGTRLVILPTLRRVDGAVWAALHTLASTGVQVVVGPHLPTHDELDRELGGDAASPPGCGLLAPKSLEDLSALGDDLLSLAGELSELWIAPEAPEVHCSVFVDEGERPRLLFVGNQSSQPQRAGINVFDACCLEDAVTSEELVDTQGVIEIALEAYQVRAFIVCNQEGT